jgi:Mg2+/Co2+ transporter CorB
MFAAIGVVAILILGLLTLSAVFSAAETAMTGASRARLHQLEREGDRAAKRVNRLIERQEQMIGAILLCNSVINILCAALVTDQLEHRLPRPWGVVVSTGVMTVLVLVYAEVLPKTLAIGRPDDVARVLSWPTAVAVRLFGPVIAAIQWGIVKTLALFGFEVSPQADASAAQEEIRGAIEYHHEEGLVEDRDRRMLGGVLDLSDMDVTEVMVHRKNIVTLDADLPTADLIAEALEAPYTRLPIYRGDPENIIGVLHARDLARAIAASKGDLSTFDIATVAKEPWFIPDTTNLKDQLQAFLKRKNHFALTVDEYGALMGLVTLEDILEEIVGEIEDEHDFAVEGVRRQPDGSVNVDGSVTIRDLNRALDWNLPDDDWVTVAGLVIHEAQTIPEPGQTFIFHGHRFQILRRQRNQITALRVSAPLPAAAPPS